MRRRRLASGAFLLVVAAVVGVVFLQPHARTEKIAATDGSTSTAPEPCTGVMDPYFETAAFAHAHPALAEAQAAHDGGLCLTAAQRTAFEAEQSKSHATAPTVARGPLTWVAPPNTAPPPEGIREGESYAPAIVLVPTNEWQHTTGGGTLTVVAGWRSPDGRGGVVVVHHTDGHVDEVKPYYAPAGVTALRIVRAVAPSRLELTADDGRVVHFDYAARTFSSP